MRIDWSVPVHCCDTLPLLILQILWAATAAPLTLLLVSYACLKGTVCLWFKSASSQA